MLKESLKNLQSSYEIQLLLIDPSLFFYRYFDIEVSNVEISVILGLFFLFIIQLKIKHNNQKFSKSQKQEIPSSLKLDEKNEISSDPVTQKIDLAIAYMNMGSIRKSKLLLGKLKKLKLTKKQIKRIDFILTDLNK